MVSRPAAVVAARRLYVALADHHGVLADVHDEAGDVVVISVGPDLLVRCERGPMGLVYRWWGGRYSRGSRRRRRPVYACCPVRDVVKAAGGIYRRYLELWPEVGDG